MNLNEFCSRIGADDNQPCPIPRGKRKRKAGGSYRTMTAKAACEALEAVIGSDNVQRPNRQGSMSLDDFTDFITGAKKFYPHGRNLQESWAKLKTRNLQECVQGGCPTLDNRASVLKNVWILGLQSRNGRRYTPEAVRGAIEQYEGAKANCNHPSKPDDPRPIADRFGRLRNVRFVPGKGLVGDLVFNPKHPMAETVRWWAENDPQGIGLSHNATGAGRQEGDVFVVEKIVRVRSVDLVAEPATTSSLLA